MQGHPEDWRIVIDGLQDLRNPKKIIDYIILASVSENDLSKLISLWLEKGYCLYCGPFIKDNEQYLQEFCQAMVKYE